MSQNNKTTALLSRTHFRPRITVISYRGLSRLIHAEAAAFRERADITIIDTMFDAAVDIARDIDRRGNADVFISAGANGAYLRDTVSLPTVQVKITGMDLARAINKARKISSKIALVSFKQRSTELDEVQQLLGIQVEQQPYSTIADGRERFHELARQGYEVIIGSSVVVELAEKEGLTGILVYSSQSVEQAIEEAIEVARIRYTETAQTKRLDTILRHINEGVVAVDSDNRIQAINASMEGLLGMSARRLIGQPLATLMPELSLQSTLDSGQRELQNIERIGHRTIVTNRIPIKQEGQICGAVLTFQEASAIERADRHIRALNRGRKLTAKYRLNNIIGESTPIKDAITLAAQYAKTDSTILITGESGTGKELFAQGIHNASRRRNRPFVALNCAAIPENLLESELFGHEEGSFTGSRRGGKSGLFELAHTGTIFLDEIGDMPVSLQTRLLRVLQEKEVLRLGGSEPLPVDIRIISATNKDLAERVQQGNFREDLYYRLNILHMHLPALRERKEDIRELMKHLLKESLRKIGCSKSVDDLLTITLPRLLQHNWPGNVREMENMSERLAVFYSDFDAQQLTDNLHFHSILPELKADAGDCHHTAGSSALSTHRVLNDCEHIEAAIASCGGNQTLAAKQLGISRTTLWRRLNKRDTTSSPQR